MDKTVFKEYMDCGFNKSLDKCSVLAAMSGGVDSSVCAALMHELGINLTGITLQLSSTEITSCCSTSDIKDARDVAIEMGFPHNVLNYAQQFKEHVVDDFVSEYISGRTPSPCIRCNQKVKFGDLMDFANKLEVDAIITGHYVKHVFNPRTREIEFWRPHDKEKDQTYFMALVPKEQMQKVRFPLGMMNKAEVRKIAKEMNLPVAEKRDSQDLCFIQNGSYRKILEEMAKAGERGIIVNSEDEILGYHDGIQNYTVGQRKKIDVPNGPWFVIKIIPNENKVVVGRHDELARDSFTVDSLNITTDDLDVPLLAQVRARHTPVPCKLNVDTGHVALLEQTNAIAPGQICAFYTGGRLVGGGRIMG